MENTQAEVKKRMASVDILIENAWKFYKTNFKKLWPLFLLGGIGNSLSLRFNYSGSSTGFGNIFSHISMPLLVSVIISLLAIVLLLYISKLALLKSISDVHKGQYVGCKDAYSKATRLFWPFILVNIIFAAALFGASLLLVVPGIILYGYLLFYQIEFFDGDKRNFKALLGSWALVKKYWWAVVGRLLLVSVCIFLVIFAFVIAAVIAGVIGWLVLTKVSLVLGIVWGSILAIAFLAFIFLFVEPLALIIMFEIYFNLKDTRASEVLENPATDLHRKRKIIASIIIGAVAIVPLVYLQVVLVNRLQKAQTEIPVSTGLYHSDIGSFSADFLGTPTVSQKEKVSVAGTSYTMYFFKREVNPNLFFTVGYANFPPSINMTDDPNKALNAGINNVTKGSGIELISSKLGLYKGYPSIDYVVYLSDYNIYAKNRSMLNGQNFYEIVATYPKDKNSDRNSKAADDFLNSFSLDGGAIKANN